MSVKRVPLPTAIIPFILDNLEGFDIALEDGERIVITAKAGVQVRPSSRPLLASLLSSADGEGHRAAPSSPRIVMRPKFIYKAKDERYTPEQAKVFGLSKPRLQVYSIVHTAGDEGVGYSTIREKSKLPHGSVMQILHWLRKQRLITGAPETSAK